MKNLLWNRGVLLLVVMAVSSTSYGQTSFDQRETMPEVDVVEDESNFGVWANYKQQVGKLGDNVMTIGGPSFGFNLGKIFFIGGGVFSSFGNMELAGRDNSMIYGGGIAGFRWNPDHRVVFRTQVLIGSVGFDTLSSTSPGTIVKRDLSVIVVPEVALDIKIVGGLYISLSANYHYVEDLPDAWEDFQGLGALTGAITLGLSF